MSTNERASLDPDESDLTTTFTLKDVIESVAPETREKTPALVCLTGASMGKVFRLEASEIEIGRDAKGLRIEDDGVSRRHARLERMGDSYTIRDIGSTNGTIWNGEKLATPVVLQVGDRIRLGPNVVLRFEMHDVLDERMRERLYELATRDALTGAFNRRAFFERLESEWAWHRRHRHPCALLALDVDHFKRINDAHGHPGGDHVLKSLAALIQATIRAEDLFARIGGEEFVILARATDATRATAMAERIRSAVEKNVFGWAGESIRVTLSVGVATSTDAAATSAQALVTRADALLYEAKDQGRNSVVTDRV